MSERRYSKEEIETIFKEAQNVDATGLTLQELQEIGREIGVAPDAVARAAAQLEVRPISAQAMAATKTRGRFGFPVRVAKTVELPRKLTESEWDQLVVDLRSTFDAQGRLDVQGSFREWRNGNLRAMLEPSAGAERFTLRSFKQNTAGVMTIAAIFAAFGGLIAFGVWARADAPIDAERRALLFFGAGALVFTVAAAQIRSWAATRRKQFDAIVDRLLSAIQRNP